MQPYEFKKRLYKKKCMKKSIGVLLVIALLSNSCSKTAETSGCQPATVASEKAQMVAYCSANGINYTEDVTGLLYEVITTGTGMVPLSSSIVSVVIFFNALAAALYCRALIVSSAIAAFSLALYCNNLFILSSP